MPSFHEQILEKETKAAQEERLKVLKAKARPILHSLLIDYGASVLAHHCGDGELVSAMVALRPDCKFTASDTDKKTMRKARDMYGHDMLSFVTADLGSTTFKADSFDAVIDLDFQATEVAALYKILKEGGMAYLACSPAPEHSRMVLLEFGMQDLEKAEALVKAAEGESLLDGFYMEERPPRLPRTRRFRLPYDKACAFLCGKAQLDPAPDFSALPLRVLKKQEEASILTVTVNDEDGNALPLPPASRNIILQKVAEDQSRSLYEHRPTREESHGMLHPYREEQSGALVDLLSHEREYAEIIPYSVDTSGHLRVYVINGAPKPALAHMPRQSQKDAFLSSYQLNSFSVPLDAIKALPDDTQKSMVLFTRDYLGLKPAADATLEEGPTFFVAPEISDASIRTFFLEVDTEKNNFPPPETLRGFTEAKDKGRVISIDAQSLLDYILAGAAPDTHLDVQLPALFEAIGKTYDAPAISLDLKTENIKTQTEFSISASYRPARGLSGQYSAIRSVFAEEGLGHGFTYDFVLRQDGKHTKHYTLSVVRNEAGEICVGAHPVLCPANNILVLTLPETEGQGQYIKFVDASLSPLSYSVSLMPSKIEGAPYITLENLKQQKHLSYALLVMLEHIKRSGIENIAQSEAA